MENNMVNCIGLHGNLGSGKATVAKIMAEYLNEWGYIPQYKIFAGKLKKITEVLTGEKMTTDYLNKFDGGIYDYTQEQKNKFIETFRGGMTIGQMLQLLGTEVFRNNFDNDTWVKALFTDYNPTPTDIWIIADLRFPNEAEEIKKRGGLVFTIQGVSGRGKEDSKRDMGHLSETAMNDYDGFDAIIPNIGTLDDLEDVVYNTLKKFKF